MWTNFMDMHSGGGLKEKPYDMIYIEAPEEEAMVIFNNRFGHNPNRVSCTCCGDDYSIDEHETLREATAYNRGCDYVYFDTKGREVSEKQGFVRGKGLKRGYTCGYVERPSEREFSWNPFKTLKDYLKNKDVLVIYKKDIKPDEREGELEAEGYVWIN